MYGIMTLIMGTKFQISQVILTLFFGVWDKNLTPVGGATPNGDQVYMCPPGNR